MKQFKFPQNFIWGSSTSSHQVEGNNHNNWSEWEKQNALRLAKGAKNYWQLWQREKFPEMFKPENYISDKACDHYNRFEQDFDLVKSFGHTAHRFSLEWSRIEPKEGKFNEKEIEHYQRIILALKERGIEPFVGLWHWTNPSWIEKEGGWESGKIIYYFSRYAEKIVSSLGDDIKFLITINEPEIYTLFSYLNGNWPPGKKNFLSFIVVIHNLIRAHKETYKIIKKIQPTIQIGIATNNTYYEACNDLISRFVKNIIESLDHFYILNRIKNYQDFIGLNYYFHNRIKGLKFNQNENKEITDLGWEIYPRGIFYVLKNLKKYQKPIYITENGLADTNDEKRSQFIFETLKNISEATDEGVDVRGYFYWSLMDNFEWGKGFWPKFGLLEIDRKSLERKSRHSAYFYKDIIMENGITEELVKKHKDCCLK